MNAAYGGRPTYGWHLRKLAEVTEGPLSIEEILSHCSIDKSWSIKTSRRGNYCPTQRAHHRRSVERALHAGNWENVSRGHWQPQRKQLETPATNSSDTDVQESPTETRFLCRENGGSANG